MMNKLFVLLLLLFGLHCSATPYNDWWQNGNRFYSLKQYDSAAYYFEKIAALKPEEATVYYNLGNAYYKLNKIGPAILNYQRALKLEPDNSRIQDNLSLTQNRIANRIPVSEDIFFVRWWKTITPANAASIWAVISLFFFLAIITGLILRRLNKADWAGPRILAVLGSMWAITLLLSFASASRRDSEIAVVMENDTPLMMTIHSAKPAGYLPEGTTVDIQSSKSNWLEVRLSDGRTGWVQQAALTRI